MKQIILHFCTPPHIKLYGMLVLEQLLFWLYHQNLAGAALWKFLYLKMALWSLIRAQNSCEVWSLECGVDSVGVDCGVWSV